MAKTTKSGTIKCLFFLIVLIIVVTTNIRGQWPTQKLQVTLSNIQLSSILDSLSTVFNVNFSYNSDLPAIHKVKSLNCKCTLYDILTQLIEDENIQFSIVENHIIFTSNDFGKSAILESKSAEKYLILKGIIVTNEDHKPLSFASIGIIGRSIGTVANINGEFILKVPSELRSDSVVFSFLGFQEKCFLVDSLDEAEKTIVLTEKTIQITPVFVKHVVAEEVVEKAMQLVSKNYPIINSMYKGFYRETIKEENEYISVCEAIINIAKSPYNSVFSLDQAHIFKGRKIVNYKLTNKLRFKLEGGIYNCLTLDIIKDVSTFLSSEYFKMYDYKYLKTVSYNNHNLYVIEFKQKESAKDYALYDGIVYIDEESKAIIASKFSLSQNGMKYAQSMFVRKKPRKFTIKPLNTSYMVFYKNMNGKYYLDYIRAELKIKAKNDRLFFNSTYTSVSEMAVTEIDTTNAYRFKRSEIAKSDDILVDSETNYDESFWGNNNIITPEASMTEALKKLNFNKNEESSFWDKLF